MIVVVGNPVGCSTLCRVSHSLRDCQLVTCCLGDSLDIGEQPFGVKGQSSWVVPHGFVDSDFCQWVWFFQGDFWTFVVVCVEYVSHTNDS